MIDTVSTKTTSGNSASSPLDVLAQGVASKQDKTTSSRTVTDRVDLSQTAKLAAEYKANAGTDGKKPAEQLAESLKQAKSVTDSFAAQLKAGRTAKSFSSTSTTVPSADFNTAVRDAVTSIMKEGKPSDLITRVVKSLFGV